MLDRLLLLPNAVVHLPSVPGVSGGFVSAATSRGILQRLLNTCCSGPGWRSASSSAAAAAATSRAAAGGCHGPPASTSNSPLRQDVQQQQLKQGLDAAQQCVWVLQHEHLRTTAGPQLQQQLQRLLSTHHSLVSQQLRAAQQQQQLVCPHSSVASARLRQLSLRQQQLRSAPQPWLLSAAASLSHTPPTARALHTSRAAAEDDGDGSAAAAADISVHRTAWGRTAVYADLTAALDAAGVPPAVVKAIRSQAPSWPALSKDPEECLHRIARLSDMLASHQAAHDMLTTHPQVLTRPPGALQHQLVRLASWLRLPLAGQPELAATTATAAAAAGGGHSPSGSPPAGHQQQQQQQQVDLGACGDLMGLVVRRPGVLFLTEQGVQAQLEDIQALLGLPPLPMTVEEDATVQAGYAASNLGSLQQALAQLSSSSSSSGGGGGGGSSVSSSSALFEVFEVIETRSLLLQEAAQQQQVMLREEARKRRVDREQQYTAALHIWRQHHQQQQQGVGSLPPCPSSNSSSMPDAAAAAVESCWPRVLVCCEPEWLFIDTTTTLPRRLKGLTQLLLPAPPSPAASSSSSGEGTAAALTTGSSSSSSRSRKLPRQPTDPGVLQQQQQQLRSLLVRAPQLIAVDKRQLSARVKALRGVLLAHLHATQALHTAALIAASSNSQGDSLAGGGTAASGSQHQHQQLLQPLKWDATLEEWLLGLLLHQPQLLLQPAKVVESRAAEVAARLAAPLPLDALLQLLTAPQLHWQHLDFLKHTQQLPGPTSTTSSNTAATPASHNDDYSYGSAAALAVCQDSATFARQNPLFPAWQAAAAAVAAACRDWRKAWGWQQQFEAQLQGPACLDWLQELEGKWQRLLLLAAGKPWIAAAAISATTNSSSKGKGKGNRRSTAAAASGEGRWPAVSLQAVAAAADGHLPYQPAVKLGPILFDLPQQHLQQLLLGARSHLQAAVKGSAEVWRQLSAAAAAAAGGGAGGDAGFPWQQQLQQVTSLLPAALAAAGWELPPGSSDAAAALPQHDPAVARSWVAEAMAPRVTPAAVAAAAARHSFWQHLQQPGVLASTLDRLHFLQQVGPEAAAAAASHGPASSDAAAAAIDPQQLWSVLAARDPAFQARFPAFSAWQRLASLVEGRPAWQEELAGMSGQQLLQWLPQVEAAWDRLAFLTSGQPGSSSSSGDSGDGGMWQAISMQDAVSAAEGVFLDMFPEAGFMSWHALQNLGDSPAPPPPTLLSQAASASLAASPPPATSAAAAIPAKGKVDRPGRREPHVDAATAASRARVLQDAAARYGPWDAELRGWGSEAWGEAVLLLTPSKLARLEYFLQVHADVGLNDPTSPPQQQQQQQAPRLLDLLHAKHPYGGAQPFKLWQALTAAVVQSGVPAWAAEWRALRGADMRGVLAGVAALQLPGPEGAREAGRQERLLQLLRPVEEGEAEGEGDAAAEGSREDASHSSSSSSSSGDDSSSSEEDSGNANSRGSSSSSSGGVVSPMQVQPPPGFVFAEEAFTLKYPGLLELGVTGSDASSTAAAAAAAARSLHGVASSPSAVPAAGQAPATATGATPPSGVSVATARLAFFQRAARQQKQHLSLQQLLTAPHAQLVQQHPKLDPGFVAAWGQGAAAAEWEVLQLLHPHLGLQAVRPEVLEGLRTRTRELLHSQPHLLLHLQHFAATHPSWQAGLAEASPVTLERLIGQMQRQERVQRLQLMVRGSFQRHTGLRLVLTMSDKQWAQHYPIAQQLSELQAAARGVPHWESQLARHPDGVQLVAQLPRLHKARARLAWLQQQGLAGQHRSALAVLQAGPKAFKRRHPDYPGDE